MRKLGMMAPLAALALLGACSRGNDARPDDALKNDLALAAQAQPYQAQQFVSPTEQPYVGYGAQPQQYNAVASYPQPVMRAPAPAPVRRTTTTARRSSSGSSRGSSSGTYYPAPAPAPKPVVKHTKRDAAIGAGAGAVIGAVTSRDKIKGGLIGAAAGAILGGVIGNNVDVHRP